MMVVRSLHSGLRESTLRDTAAASASSGREREEFSSLALQLPCEDRPKFQVSFLEGRRENWKPVGWLWTVETMRICCSFDNTAEGVLSIKGKLENWHRALLYQRVQESDQRPRSI